MLLTLTLETAARTPVTSGAVQTPTTALIDAHAVALARIAELEEALRAIFLAADNAGDEQEWADMVSAEMTDERRALVTNPD